MSLSLKRELACDFFQVVYMHIQLENRAKLLRGQRGLMGGVRKRRVGAMKGRLCSIQYALV